MSLYKKLKNSNGGFTLLELMVSFAILAIVSVMVAFIIQVSAKTYSGISNDINLQYESQTAMSQIQDYVLDCNTAVAVSSDSGTLYIFNKVDDTRCEAYQFFKKVASDELYLSSKEITGGFSKADPGNFTFGPGELMSSYVKQFSAAVSTDVKSVSITITYGVGGKTYIGRQTIALRNAVDDISSFAG
jgi:prepilin-type N-terminal cleavage/methylation domain-containing protein